MAKLAKKQPEKRPRGEQETRDGAPFFTRVAAFAPASLNEEARTADLDWTTGAEVRRTSWWSGDSWIEALSMDPAHIRMGRLNGGAPLLNSHRSYDTDSVLGVVVDGTARVSGDVGKATVRFSKRAEVEPIFADVRDGILRNISVGYVVHKWQEERNAEGKIVKRTAIDWEPYEVSIVAIPADADAQFRAFEQDEDSDAPLAQGSDNAMTPEELEKQKREAAERATREEAARKADETRKQQELIGAERQRCADITALCSAHGVEPERQARFLEEGISLDGVRAAVLDVISERNKATKVLSSPATLGDGQRDRDMIRDATAALLHRAGKKVEGDGHRHFGDANLMDLARDVLSANGVSVRSLSRHEIAHRALSSSDFATILGLAGQNMVRAAYEDVQLVHRLIAKRSTNSDFKAKNTVGVSAGQLLPEVPEGGQIKRDKIVAEYGSYALKTYAKIIPFTRRMIIDDDFGAVETAANERGRSAAETERSTFWAFVAGTSFAGPTAPDGNAVFDNTNHANFPATSATPISTTTLAAAHNYFHNLVGLDSISINADLAYIVTATLGDLDFDALLNGVFVPTSVTGAVTPRMRRAQVLVEPLISRTKKHWYGFTDPRQVSHFEYAYLSGAEGPQFSQRYGFDVDGLELKVLLDFGVGCTDWRGAYMQRET